MALKAITWIVVLVAVIAGFHFLFTYITKKNLVDKIIDKCAEQNRVNQNDLCEATESSRPFLMSMNIQYLNKVLKGEIH